MDEKYEKAVEILKNMAQRNWERMEKHEELFGAGDSGVDMYRDRWHSLHEAIVKIERQCGKVEAFRLVKTK